MYLYMYTYIHTFIRTYEFIRVHIYEYLYASCTCYVLIPVAICSPTIALGVALSPPAHRNYGIKCSLRL